jgi:predicted DNA-binding protein
MSANDPTTTIRVRRDTRDRLNRMAKARGLPASELIGELLDRAEDTELFARHASAYETLRTSDPDLLREIELEDRAWDESDLATPADAQ